MNVESPPPSPPPLQIWEERQVITEGLESECTPAYKAQAYIANFTTEHLRIIGKFSNATAPCSHSISALRFATRVVPQDLALQPPNNGAASVNPTNVTLISYIMHVPLTVSTQLLPRKKIIS